MAAVASKTASSLSELATGMSKVASSAASLGISEEQLTAQLSTIIAATRQAPESVGVALKTIYSRITDIQAGIDEDGVTLGTYTGKLAEVGIKVLDNSGKLRNMGDVIEQVGEKWQTFSNEQQIYIAQTMAGQRQYNNLIALFDNYQTGYLKALKTAQTAEGTLTKQNLIYMEDINTKLEQMTAAKESLWMGLIDTRGFKGVIDSLTTIIGKVDSLFRLLGGGKTILNTLGSLATNLMSRTMASGINTFINNRVVSKSRQNWVDFSIDMADKRLKEINEKNPDSTEALILNQKKNFLPMSKYFSRQQMEDVNKAWSESINKAIDADSVRTETQYIENIKEKFGDKLNNTQFEDHFGAFQDMEEIQKRSAKIAEEHQNFVAFMKKDTQLNNIESGYNTAIMRQQENFKNKQIELDKVNQDIEKYKKILQENKGISKDQASEVIKLQQSYRDTVNSLGKKINEQKEDQPRVNIGLNVPMTDTEDTERAKNDAINRISEREQEIKKLEKQKQEYEIQMQQKYGLLPADINIGKKTFKNNLSILSQEDLQAQQEAKKFLKEAEERQEQLNQDIDQSEKKQQELNKKRNQKLVNLFQIFTSEDIEEAKNILKENYKNSTSALSKLEKVNEEWYNNLLQSVGLDQYINAYDNEENSEKRIQELKGLSNINKTIRNAIESHGGEIEFTEIQENLISLFTNAGNIAQDFYNKLGTLEEKRKEWVKLSHQAVLAALKSEELAASALREAWIQGTIQFVSGIGQIQSGLQGIASLTKTIFNPDIDGFQKLLAIVSTIGQVFSGGAVLVNAYKKIIAAEKNLKKSKEDRVAVEKKAEKLKKQQIQTKQKDTKQTKENSNATKQNTKQTKENNDATKQNTKQTEENNDAIEKHTKQTEEDNDAIEKHTKTQKTDSKAIKENTEQIEEQNDAGQEASSGGKIKNFLGGLFGKAKSFSLGKVLGAVGVAIGVTETITEIINAQHQKRLEDLQIEIDKEKEKQELYAHEQEIITQVQNLNKAYEDGNITIYELQKETAKLQEQYKDESDSIQQLIKDYTNLGIASKKARLENTKNAEESTKKLLKSQSTQLMAQMDAASYGSNGSPLKLTEGLGTLIGATNITGSFNDVNEASLAQSVLKGFSSQILSTLYIHRPESLGDSISQIRSIEQYLKIGNSNTSFYQAMQQYYDTISSTLDGLKKDTNELVSNSVQQSFLEGDYQNKFEKVNSLEDYANLYEEITNTAVTKTVRDLTETGLWDMMTAPNEVFDKVKSGIDLLIDNSILQKYQPQTKFIQDYFGSVEALKNDPNGNSILEILNEIDSDQWQFLNTLDFTEIAKNTGQCYKQLKAISELNFDKTKEGFSTQSQQLAGKAYTELNKVATSLKTTGYIIDEQKTILANQWLKIQPYTNDKTFDEWFKNNFKVGIENGTYAVNSANFVDIIDTITAGAEQGWNNQLNNTLENYRLKQSGKELTSTSDDEKAAGYDITTLQKVYDIMRGTDDWSVKVAKAKNAGRSYSLQNFQEYTITENGKATTYKVPTIIKTLLDQYTSLGGDPKTIVSKLKNIDANYASQMTAFDTYKEEHPFSYQTNLGLSPEALAAQKLQNDAIQEYYETVYQELFGNNNNGFNLFTNVQEIEKKQLIDVLKRNAFTDFQKFKDYFTPGELTEWKNKTSGLLGENGQFDKAALNSATLEDLQNILYFLYGGNGQEGIFNRIKDALEDRDAKKNYYSMLKQLANINDSNVNYLDLVQLQDFLANFDNKFKEDLKDTSYALELFSNEILRFNAGLREGLPNLANWIEILNKGSDSDKAGIQADLRNFYADVFQVREEGIEASGALSSPEFLEATRNMILTEDVNASVQQYRSLKDILSNSLQGIINDTGIFSAVSTVLEGMKNSNATSGQQIEIETEALKGAIQEIIKNKELFPIIQSYFRLQGFVLTLDEQGVLLASKATQDEDLISNRSLDILKSINAEKSKQITNQQRLTKYVEDERDLYHDINIELNRISRTLSRLKKEQSGLFGVGLINNLNQQLDTLEEQINANNVKSNIRQQDMAARRQVLSAAGVNFDAAGNITNYLSVVTGSLNTLNNKIAEERSIQYQLNQMAGQTDTLEYQNLNLKLKQIQWERQDLEEERSRLQKNISTYDKLREEEEAAADTLADIVRERIAINLQKFDVKVKLKMDLTEAQKSWNDFKRNVLEKDNIFNPNKLISVQKDFNKLYSNMASSYQPLPQLLENLSTVEKELQNFRNNPDYTSELFNNEGQAFSKYQELMSSIENYAENVSSLEDEIKTLILTQLDNAKQTFEKQHDVFSFILNQLQHEQQLAEILYGSKAFDTQAIILNRIVENYQNELELATTEQQFWKDQYDKYLAEGNQAAADKALQNLKAVITKRNSSIENLFNVLNSQYNNLINKIAHNTQLSMTNNLGFDYINMTWDTLQRRSELYLDTVNAAYGIRNTEFAYQEAINNTSNLRSQQKIRDVMNEQLNILKSKDKLTQYDVDRAQKILTITQAQIALEEAQNNKTSLRLKRDSQGNYSYQFTADQDAINDAAKKLEDAKNDLYNFDKQALQKNLKDYFNLVTETEKQILEIRLDNNLTQEQKEAKLNELKKRFLEEEAIYVQQNANLKANLGQSELLAYGSRTAEITNLFNSSIQNLIDRSDEVVQLFEQEYDQMNQATINYEKTIKETCEKLGIDFDKFKTEGLDPVLETFKQINSNNSEIIETAKTFIDDADSYNTKLSMLQSTWSNIWSNTKDALTKAQAYVEYILGEDFKQASAALANFGKTNTAVPTITIPSVGGILDDFKSGFVTTSNGQQKTFSEMLSLTNTAPKKVYKGTLNNDNLFKQILIDGFVNPNIKKGKNDINFGHTTIGDIDEDNYRALMQVSSNNAQWKEAQQKFINNLDNYIIYSLLKDNYNFLLSDSDKTRFDWEKIQKLINTNIKKDIYWNEDILEPLIGTEKIASFYEMYKAMLENMKYKKTTYKKLKYFFSDSELLNYPNNLSVPLFLQNPLYQFDTGGYTGDWNTRNGKLAVLHEKELVLNKDDTENILNAVAIMRDTLSSKELQKIVLSNLSEKYVNMYEQAQSNKNNINNYNTQSSPIEQQVQIQANFPNVNNKKQIEAAFSDLVNLATQKALQKDIF